MPRKKRPVHPKVHENGQKMASVPPEQDWEQERIAVMPGDRTKPSYDVVFDWDSYEVRCECQAFAFDARHPKLCPHIEELVRTNVIRAGTRWDAGGLRAAVCGKPVADEQVERHARAGTDAPALLRAFARLRKKGVSCAWGVGKAQSYIEGELILLSEWLSTRTFAAAVVGLKVDQPRDGTTVLRCMPKTMEFDELAKLALDALAAEGLHNVQREDQGNHVRLHIWNEEGRPK